jgi:hypothetical protein
MLGRPQNLGGFSAVAAAAGGGPGAAAAAADAGVTQNIALAGVGGEDRPALHPMALLLMLLASL